MNRDTKANLVGLQHEAVMNVGPNNAPRRVLTAWVATRGEATRLADAFRADGADLARVFRGSADFRVVGWFPASEVK